MENCTKKAEKLPFKNPSFPLFCILADGRKCTLKLENT
jgi:hypothetical protein